jgi:hypothetical protein
LRGGLLTLGNADLAGADERADGRQMLAFATAIGVIGAGATRFVAVNQQIILLRMPIALVGFAQMEASNAVVRLQARQTIGLRLIADGEPQDLLVADVFKLASALGVSCEAFKDCIDTQAAPTPKRSAGKGRKRKGEA